MARNPHADCDAELSDRMYDMVAMAHDIEAERAAWAVERSALRAAIETLLPELVDVREYPNEGRGTFCRSCTGTLTIERQQHRREHPPSGHTKYCRWAKALGMIEAALDGTAPRDAAGD